MENLRTDFERALQDRLTRRGIADAVAIDLHQHRDDGELPWLRASDGVFWIDDFFSDRPQRGHGRQALAELCMLADERDVTIAANPWAIMREGALRQDLLERFYQSMGFGWRRDHVMVRDPLAPTAVTIARDISYQPLPNRSEFILDTCEPRGDLTSTAFVFPVAADGRILMANNRRRGIETPGGHIEPGETARQAAMREALEEVGARVSPPVAIGHQRMLSQGLPPKGWRYPLPLAYQSFFAARIETVEDYLENDECLAPRYVEDLETLRPHVRMFAERARWAVLHGGGRFQ